MLLNGVILVEIRLVLMFIMLVFIVLVIWNMCDRLWE